MNTVIITGGTGFIGTHLTQKLIAKGYRVIILTRNPSHYASHTDALQYESWDGKTAKGWGTRVNEAHAIINLAGEPIAAIRWTKTKKEKILQSRIQAGNAVTEAIMNATHKPTVVIQASAIGYYGSQDRWVNELSEAGSGFLSEVVKKWEDSTKEVSSMGVRYVAIRTGLVLGAHEGLLKFLIPIFKFYLGGYFGSGSHWISWIHIEDEVNAIIHCLENPTIQGPVNLVSPNPVEAKYFYSMIARLLHRPCIFRVPSFILSAAFGEVARELLLTNQKVYPDVLMKTQFTYTYPDLHEALRSILQPR